jgi:hypothetical protein
MNLKSREIILFFWRKVPTFILFIEYQRMSFSKVATSKPDNTLLTIPSSPPYTQWLQATSQEMERSPT